MTRLRFLLGVNPGVVIAYHITRFRKREVRRNESAGPLNSPSPSAASQMTEPWSTPDMGLGPCALLRRRRTSSCRVDRI